MNLQKQRTKNEIQDNNANLGSLELQAKEQAVIKNRIAACALVSAQAHLEHDDWMILRWKAAVDIPEARAHHVSAVLGAGLIVHGGQSSDGNRTLSDWNLFDFGLQMWINCVVLAENLSSEVFNHARKYHTMTAVSEPAL